jgi:hypothetical protein
LSVYPVFLKCDKSVNRKSDKDNVPISGNKSKKNFSTALSSMMTPAKGISGEKNDKIEID